MATKNRHKVSIWITAQQYDALWDLKGQGAGSLNEIMQDAVGNHIAYLIREIHPELFEKYPWVTTPSRP